MPFTAHFSHRFEHTWERVTQAFWLKYQHPRMGHIKEVIVLNRAMDESGRLSTRRLIIAQLSVPKILSSFVSRRMDSYYAIEDSVVDPLTKSFNVTMRNVSYSRVVDAVQQGTYAPFPDSEGTATLYETKVEITCNKSVPWFIRSRAEASMGKEQSRSYSNTLSILEDLCAALAKNPDHVPAGRSSTPQLHTAASIS